MLETNVFNQFLSFILRDEFFAVEIFKVREVLDVTTLTRIPRMPQYLAGVINLRGTVVPVMDLGLKLGMGEIVRGVATCIMIMEIRVPGEHNDVLMGVLTDAVQEVLELPAEDIEPVPKMGVNLNTDFIKGMGRQGERFMILLDIDKILSTEGELLLRDQEEEDLVAQSRQEPHSGKQSGKVKAT